MNFTGIFLIRVGLCSSVVKFEPLGCGSVALGKFVSKRFLHC
ncbi:MAG: hypothetical protein JWM68_3214 [Verrucomicrobiales bacterium]|nr:hypothetical protein [Verrucomicrobiales bacterium]